MKSPRLSKGRPSQGLYLTAEEAANALGIAVPSLYAYVSRKGIRSQPVPGTRARLYWREDIDKIARGQNGDRTVKWDSILVPETKITLLTDDGHFYRGRSAIALSATASLEEVAALLWEQEVNASFPRKAPEAPIGFAEARAATARLSSIDQALSLFPILEAGNLRNYDRSAAGFARTGGELLRWFAALVVHADRPSAEPIHVVLGRAFSGNDNHSDLIRRLLVLFADHELSATTYAVRAVANTGSTPYQAVMAGLIASKGQRITEGRAPSIKRFIEEVLNDPDPGHPVVERHRAGEALPGFSHSLYRGGDIRARALLGVMVERFAKQDDFKRLHQAIDVARDDAGVEPDLALLSLFIERKLKHRGGLGSIQIVARSVGWIAHAREQLDSGPIVRPRSAYTGVLPADPQSFKGNMHKPRQD